MLHQVHTAKVRDWVVGEEAFEFKYVRDIDREGKVLPAANVPPLVATGKENMSVFVMCSPKGPEPHEVRVCSMETVGLLRQRLSHTLNYARVQIVFEGNMVDCDEMTLDEIGIRSQSQLQVVPTAIDNAGYYELSTKEQSELNERVAGLREVARNLRGNMPSWTAVQRHKLSGAQNALDLACSTMHVDVTTMVQSHAKLWGREMASKSGENMGTWFEPNPQPSWSAPSNSSRTPTADVALLRAGSAKSPLLFASVASAAFA